MWNYSRKMVQKRGPTRDALMIGYLLAWIIAHATIIVLVIVGLITVLSWIA